MNRTRIKVSFLDDPFYQANLVFSSSPKHEEISDWCLNAFGQRPRNNGHFHNYTNPVDRDRISALFYQGEHCVLYDFTDPDEAMMFKLAWG